jgi:hypothetical protein
MITTSGGRETELIIVQTVHTLDKVQDKFKTSTILTQTTNPLLKNQLSEAVPHI